MSWIMVESLMTVIALLQFALGCRVVARFIQSMRGTRVLECAAPLPDQTVSIILPVLNERARIEGCLQGCMDQTEEVTEILVVDGGSEDGTQELVCHLGLADPRVRLIRADPVPETWTGKSWGLQVGLECSSEESQWLLCVDADVRIHRHLSRSLIAHALRSGVITFSVASQQQLADPIDAALHPSMLATLIYRFGLPGRAVSQTCQVQANGQCFLCPRDLLMQTKAVRTARTSICEDITISRCIVSAGFPTGFYEAEAGLVRTAMYADWRETWNNWPRSLCMRDLYFGWRDGMKLAEIAFVQALALPLFASALLLQSPAWLIAATGSWTLLRLGVLGGARRAYPERPWSYWLSPLADLPVVVKIIADALKRRHSWRGRRYVRTRGGRFRVAD
jgi:dolichol-phosphate mannosyltransferase